MEYWNVGIVETMDKWNDGMLKEWMSGTMEEWNIGIVER